MIDIQALASGVNEFCAYLRAQGIAARVLPKDSPVQQDWGFFSHGPTIEVQSSHISQIRLRMAGVVGPSQMLGSGAFTFSVGPLPVLSRKPLPIQYDYLIRKDPGAEASAYETELSIITRGFLNKEVTGVEWKGKSRLAKTLAADSAIMGAVRNGIRPNEALRIIPDANRRIVRINHKSYALMSFSLFQKDIVQMNRDFPSRTLLEAIGRIAGRVASQL